MIATLPRWAKHVAAPGLRRLNIRPRLTLCFMLIIVAMLAGNAVLVWQFRQAGKQAERLAGVDQELITVLQAHTGLMSFYERLDALARSEDSVLLLKQLETLQNALLRDAQHSRDVLSRLSPEAQVDPTLLPTFLAIQGELPAQLEAAAVLAKTGDWDAVRLRLTNQIRPLESRSSALVENIDREVDEARAQAVLNIQRAQRRIVMIVSLTAALTLLFAAFLGLVITRSITQPLGRLVEGSAALARGDFSHRVPATGNDEITRVGSVFNDMILTLQELYRELQSRETYLAEAQQLSHTGSFGWDTCGGEIYWSAETFRIFQFEPNAEVTIDVILERTHPEDRASLEHFFTRVSSDRAPFDMEHRLLMPDGAVKHLRVVGRPSTDEGGRCEFVGAVTDITDRRRAEAELKQAYHRLAEAQRLSKTGSFITDLRADEHNWSEEGFRIFEFDPGTKVTVKMIRGVVHPEDLPSFDAMIARAMAGMDVDFVFRIVTPRGAVKHVRGLAHVIEQVAGRPLFSGAVQDVTEIKVAEEALNRARSELAHVVRVTTLNTLTASITHEVNQPLSGIITNASTCLRMLSTDPPNVEGARETARRTIRDGNRAADVITRLRALFGKKEVAPEFVDLNEATREVIALSLGDLQRNRVIARTELANDLPPVNGDRVQLQQVILNLLRNGSDAMSTVQDRPRELLIRTERDEGNQVRLSVKDSGVGFTPHVADKLFEAFYTTKADGMGIGLSVSRSIIESHHGRLWAVPNDGPGATFSFAIPCTLGSLAASETHVDRTDPATGAA